MPNEGLTFEAQPDDGETFTYSFQHTGGEANSNVINRTWSWNEHRNAWVSNYS